MNDGRCAQCPPKHSKRWPRHAATTPATSTASFAQNYGAGARLRLDDCSHLLAGELLDLWPLAAVLARKTSGRMMGGTALALHLQHRAGEDIDIMTLKGFSGAAMRRRMTKYARRAR